MTAEERQALKIAKSRYKSLKQQPEAFREQKNEILYAFVKSPIPEWGSISIKI